MEYPELVSAVLGENRKVLEAVSPKEVDQLIDEILKARSVHLYAMGRMQLSVRAFAMRLTHMGIPTYVVFDTTSPRIGPGDLLIRHCAVTNVELNVVGLAKEAGARIALLTAHPENEHGKLADLCVRVPVKSLADQTKSSQSNRWLRSSSKRFFSSPTSSLCCSWSAKTFPFKRCRRAIPTWKAYPALLLDRCLRNLRVVSKSRGARLAARLSCVGLDLKQFSTVFGRFGEHTRPAASRVWCSASRRTRFSGETPEIAREDASSVRHERCLR